MGAGSWHLEGTELNYLNKTRVPHLMTKYQIHTFGNK